MMYADTMMGMPCVLGSKPIWRASAATARCTVSIMVNQMRNREIGRKWGCGEAESLEAEIGHSIPANQPWSQHQEDHTNQQ